MMIFILACLIHCLSLIQAAPVEIRQAGPSAYCSNADGSYKLSPLSPPIPGPGNPGSQAQQHLQVDDTPSGYRQSITGFGATVSDATVASFNELPSATLNALLNDLMTSAGANFSLLRHTIGASDLSANPPYTYDDNGGNPDPSLSSFNLGDRGIAMASMLARMKSLNPSTQILGSPWSAPGWMKLNGEIDGNTTENNLNDGYLTGGGQGYSSQYAQYFVKYIQAYQALGAPIDAITIQNEPLNSVAGYPTMYVYAYEAAALIQNFVGPALAAANLATQIWAYDHNTDVPSYPATVVQRAGQYVGAVAWHCYASSLDWSVLSQFHTVNPNTPQLMTECWTPSFAAWFNAANFTIGPLQNYASGVFAWTLGTDNGDGPHLSTGGCDNCQGLVTISNGNYVFNLAYYLMAQFSKFMPPGAVILSSNSQPSYPQGTGVQFVASSNPDGSRTVVVMNTLNNAIYLTVNFQSGSQWSGSIPADSVTTWVVP